MATIQDLKTQIENANALGRTNLSEKGVKLPETATTYNIMQAIAEIVGSSGTEYTSIVYNTDNTITLTDKGGAVHTMSCTYENGKLIGVTYDGKAVDLTYNGDVLVKVGKTDIKLNNTEQSKLQVDNPIATTELTGYEAAKAFDGDIATRWATTPNQYRGGIGAEFETPCKIAYARCTKSQYDWKNLTLQCSDDGINWVNASEEIAEPIYDVHGSTTIQSIESGLHKWWRVYSSSCETVAEIEFYGFAVSKQYQNGFALGLASGGVVESEGVKFNIAYGETPPDDTSKLWIKANEPNNIKIGSGDLSYIESTGTQYIDTGYIANQNTRIKCKYKIVGYKGDYDTLFSDFTNIQYSPRYEQNLQLIKWGGQYITYGSALSSSGITTLKVNNGTFTFIENGETTTQVVGADTVFTSPYSILLFCNRYYNNVSQYESATCCKARIYYFQIYEGEMLVRDFVPAVDENAVVCLYDNVTKAYFYNQGEGVFGSKIITHELTQGNIEIKTSLTENKFNLINTENAQVELGVENVYIGNANNEAEPVSAYLYNGTEWKQISYGV